MFFLGCRTCCEIAPPWPACGLGLYFVLYRDGHSINPNSIVQDHYDAYQQSWGGIAPPDGNGRPAPDVWVYNRSTSRESGYDTGYENYGQNLTRWQRQGCVGFTLKPAQVIAARSIANRGSATQTLASGLAHSAQATRWGWVLDNQSQPSPVPYPPSTTFMDILESLVGFRPSAVLLKGTAGASMTFNIFQDNAGGNPAWWNENETMLAIDWALTIGTGMIDEDAQRQHLTGGVGRQIGGSQIAIQRIIPAYGPSGTAPQSGPPFYHSVFEQRQFTEDITQEMLSLVENGGVGGIYFGVDTSHPFAPNLAQPQDHFGQYKCVPAGTTCFRFGCTVVANYGISDAELIALP